MRGVGKKASENDWGEKEAPGLGKFNSLHSPGSKKIFDVIRRERGLLEVTRTDLTKFHIVVS